MYLTCYIEYPVGISIKKYLVKLFSIGINGKNLDIFFSVKKFGFT